MKTNPNSSCLQMILFNPYTHNSFIWMMLKVFMFSNFCWYLNNLTSVSCQHKRLSQLIPQFCRACIIWSYFWHGEYNSRRYILIYTTLSIVVEVTNHIGNGNKTTSNIPTRNHIESYLFPTYLNPETEVCVSDSHTSWCSGAIRGAPQKIFSFIEITEHTFISLSIVF